MAIFPHRRRDCIKRTQSQFKIVADQIAPLSRNDRVDICDLLAGPTWGGRNGTQCNQGHDPHSQ
jgi:hypothetical protein